MAWMNLIFRRKNMRKFFIAMCICCAATFAKNEPEAISQQDSVQMCPCPEKKGFFAKATKWVSDHPEETVTAGTALASVAAVGYIAMHDCERYDILIEYKLMDVCIRNCRDEEKCAERIVEWECKQKIGPKDAEIKNRSCPIK